MVVPLKKKKQKVDQWGAKRALFSKVTLMVLDCFVPRNDLVTVYTHNKHLESIGV